MSERTCKIEGCAGRHYGRGWCGKHYMRWRKSGDPLVLVAREAWSRKNCSEDGCSAFVYRAGLCGSHARAAGITRKPDSRPDRPCQYCGENFRPTQPSGKYCSFRCAARGRVPKEQNTLRAQGKKRCGICSEIKDRDEFYRRPTSGPDDRDSKCKQCKLMRQAEHNARPEVRKHKRIVKWAHRYGLEMNDYENMLARQGGRCAICGEEPPGDDGVLHVDHCHETGRIRGLLCRVCNAGIGHFRDDVGRLARAIAYLKENR